MTTLEMPAALPPPPERRRGTHALDAENGAADPVVCCWNLVRRALGAAHFTREEMAELTPLPGEPERQAVARVIEHLECALEELRPLGPGWTQTGHG